MPKSRKKIKEELSLQITTEKQHFKEARERRYPFWQRNEKLFLGIKDTHLSNDVFNSLHNSRNSKTEKSRSNIFLPKMQGFVNTLLSKVDAPPNIVFTQGEEADLIKAKRMNAFKDKIAQPAEDNWAFKDLMGKKQAIMYGRGIFEYHSEHIKGVGFRSHLSNVDVYDFLIDPDGGGLDIENARAMGRGGIVKTIQELRQGVKDKRYERAAVEKLIDSAKDGRDTDEDDTVKDNNRYFTLIQNNKRIERKDEFRFYEWYTTFEGVRYQVLMHMPTGIIIRLKTLQEVFKSNLWPFFSYATDPDLIEFWTPSPADAVAEIFMAQMVLINQHFDNNEEINKPMKAFDSGAVENPALLKWRRGGSIPFKKGTDIRRAFQVIRPEVLQNNERMFQLLDSIAQTETGVTADAKGLSEEDKVGIFEGNLANIADRLGLNNKSFANGYHKLGTLFLNGVKQNLITKEAIKMIGNDGVDYEEVNKNDIMPKGRDFDIDMLSTDPEINGENTDKQNKLRFLEAQVENGNINPKALFEMRAEIIGFDPSQIKRLMDTDNFANSEVLSEAANDFQLMVQGKILEPNKRANNAYRQRMIDLLIEKEDRLPEDTQKIILAYIDEIQEVVVSNTIRQANQVARENIQNMSEEGITALTAPTEELANNQQ